MFPLNSITPPPDRVSTHRKQYVPVPQPRFNEIERRSNVPPGQQRCSASSGARRVFGIRTWEVFLPDETPQRGARGLLSESRNERFKEDEEKSEKGEDLDTRRRIFRRVIWWRPQRTGSVTHFRATGAAHRFVLRTVIQRAPFPLTSFRRRSTLPAGYRRETCVPSHLLAIGISVFFFLARFSSRERRG